MSAKIYKDGNYLIVDVGVSDLIEVVASQVVAVKGANNRWYLSVNNRDILPQPLLDSEIEDENGVVYADFKTWIRDNTGFSTAAGGSAANELVIVNSVSDLPSSVGGVITLVDNYTYFITNTIDLQGDRLVCGENTTIIGGSSENCRIKSTGLTDPLITSVYSLPIRNITIEAQHALDLDGSSSATTAIDWFGVNFTDCAVVGTIANYNNFIMTDSALLNSSGLTFDGTFGTVGFTQCLFDGRSASTTITIPSTATITRRFRVIYSSFVSLSGETSLNVSSSASIPVEGYILDTVNFSGGGTYTAGVQFNDNKSLFVNCRGISNSAELANYYMQNNATLTDIVTQGVAIKIAGTTTAASINQRFTHSNNRATYVGALTRAFKVSAVASVTSATANKQIGFYVAKNGAVLPDSEMYVTTNANNRAESVAVQTIVSLATNDYIEIYVENDTDNTDVTVTYLNTIIESLN
jgi:hypothetical protein